MTRRNVLLLTVAIVVAIVIAAIAYLVVNRSNGAQQLQNASQAPVAALLSVGAQAPQFTALTTAGSFDLSKTRKPVFLEVFATWCPHCQRETVVLNRLYTQFAGKVAFVAVSGSATGMNGLAETPQDVIQFRQMFHVLYPIAFDGSLSVAQEYLQGGFPTIVIISSEKKIVYLSSGEIAEAKLAAQLAQFE